MASVRLTNNLRDEIHRKAMKAFDLANPKPKASTAFVTLTKHAVYNGPQQTYLRHCLQTGTEMGIDKQVSGKELLPTPREKMTSITLVHDDNTCEINFNTPIDHLERTHDSWYHTSRTFISDLDPKDRSEMVDHFLTLKKAQREHDAAKTGYRVSIEELLQACSTLKQLLEIWPAAESLVDQKHIQKMHTKITRAKRAQQVKEEIKFDPTIANQAVLTAKMLGA